MFPGRKRFENQAGTSFDCLYSRPPSRSHCLYWQIETAIIVAGARPLKPGKTLKGVVVDFLLKVSVSEYHWSALPEAARAFIKTAEFAGGDST